MLAIKASAKPSRTELANAALEAATELGIMMNKSGEPQIDRISDFRLVLHQTTEGWLDDGKDHPTDALTARLYFDALEQSHGDMGRTDNAKSVDDFLARIKGVVQDFDDFDEKRKDPTALQEMLKFALALHTLLVGEAYGRISHWKHKELF